MMKALSLFFVTLILFGCINPKKEQQKSESRNRKSERGERVPATKKTADTCALEKKLVDMGLVEITSVVPGIKTDLRYSTTANFMKMDLYGDLERIYTQPDVAQKLKKAQEYLKQADSSLTLLIFDCVRPLYVQQQMWDTVKMPAWKKIKFLSNPAFGSVHNYGAAVDISISTVSGKELDMGTPYDDTASLAYPILEAQYLASGKLTKEQVKNRQLLRNVMYKAGFFGIQTEWWHFNSCTREAAMSKYKRVD